MTTFMKDPDAVLDYSVDWSKWLAGDQIETSTWFVSNPALQPSDDSNTTTRTTIWLAGGVAGQCMTSPNPRRPHRANTIAFLERSTAPTDSTW